MKLVLTALYFDCSMQLSWKSWRVLLWWKCCQKKSKLKYTWEVHRRGCVHQLYTKYCWHKLWNMYWWILQAKGGKVYFSLIKFYFWFFIRVMYSKLTSTSLKHGASSFKRRLRTFLTWKCGVWMWYAVL